MLWAVSGSLKSDGDITEPTVLPAHPRWSNYGRVFDTLPMGRMLFNTTGYALCVTAGQVFFCSLAGYAFARLRFRGRDVLFLAYLGTLMVPLTVTVIPQFLLMRVLGWVDTPWAVIVPGLFGSAFGTYLMRQFFRTLPVELEEAAILDGCTTWQIYWRVLLPHTRPALMVLAVLTLDIGLERFPVAVDHDPTQRIRHRHTGSGPPARPVPHPVAAADGRGGGHPVAAARALGPGTTRLRARHSHVRAGRSLSYSPR